LAGWTDYDSGWTPVVFQVCHALTRHGHKDYFKGLPPFYPSSLKSLGSGKLKSAIFEDLPKLGLPLTTNGYEFTRIKAQLNV
jgi:hypothetical protein